MNDGSSVLTATGTGTANTFGGGGAVNFGTVTLEDRRGSRWEASTQMVTVNSGASLHLVANVGHVDSISGVGNELQIYAPLTIDGTGDEG